MPYENVARFPDCGVGGGQVRGAGAQRAAGLGGRGPGLFDAAGVGLGRFRCFVGVLVGRASQQVGEEGRRLLEAAGGVLGGAVRVQQFAVCRAGGVQRVGPRREFVGGGTEQGLGLVHIGGDLALRQVRVGVAVGGGEPFGLAAQAAQLLAGGRGA